MMKKTILLFSVFLTTVVVAQNLQRIDPVEGSGRIYSLEEAKAVIDSLNNLPLLGLEIKAELTKNAGATTQIIAANYKCDKSVEICRCEGDDICEETRYGIKYNGNWVLKPFATQLKQLEGGRIVCALNNKLWEVNLMGEPIGIPVCVDDINNYFKLAKKGRYGVVDQHLEEIISYDFNWIGMRNLINMEEYANDLNDPRANCYPVSDGDKCGIVDETYMTILPFEYEAIAPVFTDEQIIVKKNGKWGLTNFNQEILLPFIFDSVAFNGAFIALKKEKWAMVKRDLSDYFTTVYQYDDFKTAMNNHLNHFAKKGGYWMAFNEENKQMTNTKYTDVMVFPLENQVWDVPVVGVKKDEKWGLLDCHSEEFKSNVDFLYSEILDWSYNRSLQVTIDGDMIEDNPLFLITVMNNGEPLVIHFW